MTAAAYDPTSTLVVTADGDGTARIFSAATGRRLALLSHSKAVTDAAFSPDGQMVATASRDHTIRLWTRGGKPIRRLHHSAPVVDLEFSRDGRVLVSTTAKGRTYIWRRDDNYSHVVLSTPAPARVAISDGGEFVVVFDADRFARVYDVATGAPVSKLEQHSRVLTQLSDGKRKCS